ncbi:class I SAM-dependent methyltransferase [Nesterenkonia alba]|uniref:class I SAM-dependent methyltransferase n=1 Tax=Nesterenkonia alba TaxID=515814 RepID=UPI0003B74276|nr:class I SAM-dependent methyltransferase [Nesterenkonia alba]
MALYDSHAESYDAHAQVSPFNALYDRPALLTLLGDVAGLRVLDAGCGSGLYARELIAQGAKLTGFDASGELLQLARQRLGETAELRVHDLAEPLHWAEDGTYDRVLMALVLHYLPDPVPALRELHRVLTDDGKLVLSTHHPSWDWARLEGSYFTDTMIDDEWSIGLKVRYRRRPLQTLVDEFSEAGFIVERLVEPRPVKAMAKTHPEIYEQLTTEPGFIMFQLAKR